MAFAIKVGALVEEKGEDACQMEPKLKKIAHAARESSTDVWREPHTLEEHLIGAASLARVFASPFGPKWAELAARWHDLGKYRPRFQSYIRQASGFEADAHIKGETRRAPHSTAGALWACKQFDVAGRVLAYIIAGHHAGLDNWFGGLENRLNEQDSHEELEETLGASPPEEILSAGNFKPILRTIPGGKDGFSFWVRMLFSSVVDADFLDTERYMDPDRFASRNRWPSLAELVPVFDAHMERLVSSAAPTPVNTLRADILRQCREKASLEPGLFSLTVPTGGGKTLSGIAFALNHAKIYDKRRIIYVIPYTSIIEQTADVFRGIFGEVVIEHHSNAETKHTSENIASRIACENWDAPIIVSTNVQFFESLFASRTSRCRKLHNIVNSIVILDEAQLLPPGFLQPIVDVLRLLSKYYGVTIVFSTATQTELGIRCYFDAKRNFRGLENVREIIDDPDALYQALDRAKIYLPADWNTTVQWSELAKELVNYESVLAIVNTRRDARELWKEMPEGTLHLSALMCGAHRSHVITEIKTRLKHGMPTRVISTQLVEAGVDVDFPVVYRAMAGLDSIVQSAGRCNRDGRLEKGKVVIFNPPKMAPPGLIRQGQEATRLVFARHGNQAHIEISRDLFAEYFERLYFGCDLDKEKIVDELFMAGGRLDGNTLAVNFRTAAEKFKLVSDEDTVPIVVLYRGPDEQDHTIDQLLRILRKDGPDRWLMRKLQRYTVNLYKKDAEKLLTQSDIEEVVPGLYVQISDWLYDPLLGLNSDGIPIQAIKTVV